MARALTPRLLVFDLDGTLIDSRQDLANSINGMLKLYGRQELSQAMIASFIGNGASMLVQQALSATSAQAGVETEQESAVLSFLDLYRRRKLEHTYVYPGVLSAMAEIQFRWPGVLMACLTNKPVGPAREICSALGLAQFFFQNYGGNSFSTKKPDPFGMLQICKEAAALLGARRTLEALLSQTVMIGDSVIDAETARRSGTLFVGCTFGFDPESLKGIRASTLAHAPSEWAALIATLLPGT